MTNQIIGYEIGPVDVERVDPETGEWESATVQLPTAIGRQREIETQLIEVLTPYRFTRMTSAAQVRVALFVATSMIEQERRARKRGVWAATIIAVISIVLALAGLD